MEVTSLQPPVLQNCPQGQQNFSLSKDWRAGISGVSKPEQSGLSVLVWKTDHRHSVWAQAVPLFWGQEKPSPHHSHSQLCVLQWCLKIDICEPSKLNHLQHALDLWQLMCLYTLSHTFFYPQVLLSTSWNAGGKLGQDPALSQANVSPPRGQCPTEKKSKCIKILAPLNLSL